nr:phage-related tail fiber protein [uncultured Mediterranean phage uvMED]
MAGLEISKLPPLNPAQLEADDEIAIVDTSAADTKKIGAGALVDAGLSALADGSVDPAVLDLDALAAGSIDGAAIAARSIPAAKIIADSLTAAEIAPQAIDSSELADDAVSTQKIQDLAVTTAKIATEAITDDKVVVAGISRIANDAVGTDQIADGAVTAAQLAAGSVDDSKLATGIDGGKIAPGTIEGDALNDSTIGKEQLQLQVIEEGLLADGAVTDVKVANGIDGAKIADGTITGQKLTTDSFAQGIELDGGQVVHTNQIAAATVNGITFDEQGHITGTTPLDGVDIPVATDATVGGISVPAGSGLVVNAAGAIDHQTLLAEGEESGISFDEHGHITATRPLEGADLPPATATALGAVSVPGDQANPLGVEPSGALRHKQVPLTPGTYVSVQTDQYGHIVDGEAVLTAGQVPDLPASKITSGQFPAERLGDGSVTAPKIGDYATVLMQEDNPGVGDYLGQLWWSPSTAQLRVFARGSGPENIWRPVGFGALQANNLRWGGTYNADTDQIVILTALGVSEGLEPGSPFPVPSNQLSGLYFICEEGGANMTQPNLSGQTHAAGDWALCVDEVQGWTRIEAAGGGGGGAQYLSDLLDVDIDDTYRAGSPFETAPKIRLEDKHILVHDGGSGVWKNTNIIDGGSID